MVLWRKKLVKYTITHVNMYICLHGCMCVCVVLPINAIELLLHSLSAMIDIYK